MITIPTLSELNTAIIADIEAKFGAPVSMVGKSFLRIWAGTMAGTSYLMYIALAKVQKNIFVDTCDYETLVRFGRVKLGRNPFPATAGIYNVEVTGTIGAVIPVSSTFKSDDDSANPGNLFILDSAVTLVASTQIIQLRCLSSGVETKLDIGDTLTATAPIALVDSQCEVDEEITAPLSAESESEYRTKVLNAFRLEPQGGAGSDYRLWSADVQEVANSYPFAAEGFTQVNLFIEAKLADSTDSKGTPSSDTLDDVQAAIEEPTVDRPSRKPILSVVNYLPVTPLDVVITITGFVGDTPEIQDLIESAILEETKKIRPFVSSIDVLSNKNDILSNFKLIGIIMAANPGSIFSDVSFTVDGSPETSFTFENGDIPFLDSVIFA
jgi:hypothetical protein